jgi:hypothetical protein
MAKKQYYDALDNLLDRPIAFNPSFKKITGSTNAALLLSQAFYWTKRTTDPDGWFYKTRDDWMDETGLTAEELDGARDKCKAAGVIEEKRKGVPATIHYRIIKPRVYELLGFQIREIPQSGLPEIPKSRGNPESGSDPNFNKESETTPGNTTEREGAPLVFDFENMTIPQAYKVPTLKMYNTAAGFFPADILWKQVHEFITSHGLTEEQIKTAAVAWVGRGYNRRNVMGILEWAANGVPGNGQKAGEPKPAIDEQRVSKTVEELADKWSFKPAPPPSNRPRIGRRTS